jgi:hypothetical protein
MALVDFDCEEVTSKFLHGKLEQHFVDCRNEFQYIKDRFRQNQINGRVLTSLTDDDLRQNLQIESFGHRRLILICVGEFQLQSSKKFKLKAESIKSLLETMLLINALILSFAFSSFAGLEHDKIVEADARYLNMLLRPNFRQTYSTMFYPERTNAFLKGDPVGMEWLGKRESSLLSVLYFQHIMEANVTLFATLIAGSALYVSFTLANFSENEDQLQLGLFLVSVLGGFVSLYFGLAALISSYVVFGNMMFPLYDTDNLTKITSNLNETLKTVEMNINGGYAYFGLKSGDYLHVYKTACWIIFVAVAIQHALLFNFHHLQYLSNFISRKLRAQQQSD